MISVFGDESSSRLHATYGLLAIADEHLYLLDKIVAETRRILRASSPEPLHCRVLFHGNYKAQSAYRNASLVEIERACAGLIAQVASLNVAFYFGRVDREKAPKVLHVPLIDDKDKAKVLDARLKLELPHLQLFAYGAAATRACHVLPNSVKKLIVDRNKSVVQWFNERRQASRLLEIFAMDATLPQWPVAIFGDDAEYIGLQIVDILTYYATKQFFDHRFAFSFDAIRQKTTFMVQEFDTQAYQPYVAPAGVTLVSLPKKSDSPT